MSGARNQKKQVQANAKQIQALRKVTVALAANQSIERRRQTFIRSGIDVSTSHDTKRPEAWRAYGWPESVEFVDFYEMFTRNPIANAVVMRMPDKCWESEPVVSEHEDQTEAVDNPTGWDSSLSKMLKRTKFWSRCEGADWRQRIGRYAGLIIIAKEPASKTASATRDEIMSSPLQLNSLDQIERFIPCTEEQLEVLVDEIDQDPTSLRFGLPVYYNYQENELGSKNDRARESFNVHHSRVIVFAEGAETGISIYGRSVLEPCYNNLINLEKIWGGGAEGFLLNARSPKHVNMQAGDNAPDPAALAQMLGVSLENLGDAFGEQLDGFTERVNAHLLTQGMEVNSMSVNIPSPKEYAQVELEACAASSKTPVPIIVGQQISQRSSDENAKEFGRSAESRRNTYLIPQIEAAINHIIDLGATERREFTVHWDSLLNDSPSERAELFSKITAGVKNLTGTGVAAPAGIDKYLGMVLEIKPDKDGGEDEGGSIDDESDIA